jgi:hypothetical protein
VTEPSPEGRRRLTLELSLARIASIDALKKEWGLRNRGAVLERLLDTIFSTGEEPEEDGAEEEERPAAPAPADGGAERLGLEEDLDEHTALVLIGRGALDQLDAAFEAGAEGEGVARPAARAGGGIDLPGFVRKRSDQLRRSLRAPAEPAGSPAPLPQLPGEVLAQALEIARQHWLDLYGKPANEAVLEAAMVWLGKDIWPQSDQCEGRPFTWSVVSRVMREWVPAWLEGPPSFERVMVAAGVLEDPFSGATLPLRIPTLIRRFVHRFRRRRAGTSFLTLEHTMTLQGALRLLQLPTDPGQRLTLGQIREAYREMALTHHPDSGGSVEAMRRLNEAYQLLKELYRRQDPGGP